MPLTSRSPSAGMARNDSSGAESQQSQDTLKAPSRGSESKPSRLTPQEKQRFAEESDLSPGSLPPLERNGTSAIAPWEDDTSSNVGSQNLDLTNVRSTESFPSPNWDSLSMRSDQFSRSYSGLSSSFQPPHNSADPLDIGSPADDRRPSIASAATSNSDFSMQANGRHAQQKLQGFFGEDVPFDSPAAGSPTGMDPVDGGGRRPTNHTQSSFRNSPATLQPQPSSDVTPWMFQDPEDIQSHGEAAARREVSNMEKGRRQSSFPLKSHGHKFSIHRHRQQKSNDEYNIDDETKSRQASFAVAPRRDTQPVSSDILQKDNSGWQSTSSSAAQKASLDGDADSAKSIPTENGSSSGRRSLFSKLRGRKKEEKSDPEALNKAASSSNVSLTQVGKAAKETLTKVPTSSPSSSSQAGKPPEEPGLFRTSTGSRGSIAQPNQKKEHTSRLPFKSRKSEAPVVKDPNTTAVDANKNESLWTLDTDLTHMEGIVSQTPAVGTPSGQKPNPFDDPAVSKDDSSATPGTWEVPDSWNIRKDEINKLNEADETSTVPEEPDPGVPFSIRVYRPDSSFATLSLSLNATAAELVKSIAKKSLLQDDVDNYHIILRRYDTSRKLDPGERPIAIQKRFLEQAGYKESDHIEELGREDHSYLCRFNFQHAKMSGYASLEKDPGFSKSQRLNNVDLSGRNLVTIPIALYKKCTEIYSINLSRNLSLDVPKDFIQSCTGLREIKYTANEASKLPQSFCLASKLQYLDISNNRFEQLEHAPLDKLENLISLKISNNKLSSLPPYLTHLKNLRHLNISSNSLQELPSALSDLPTLIDLDISFNAISSLPCLGKMTSLERLWATNNKLSGRLEDSMAEMTSLREIDIRFNALDNIDVCAKIPLLENLMAGHNAISVFEGYFPKIRSLLLDHNPITRFDFDQPIPSLSALSLASAKLSHLPDELFEKISNLTKLNLDKNHLASLSKQIGRLQKLESLSIIKNALLTLPSEIGHLSELRFLDARENNINHLPSELWLCRRLETLNLSANVLDAFPKQPANIPVAPESAATNGNSLSPPSGEDVEEGEKADKIGEMGPRRLSQVSGTFSNNSSSPSTRKGSISSTMGNASRKPSMLSRTSTEATMSPLTRKDSIPVNRVSATFSGSLKHLLLAENRLTDECFDQIPVLQELRVLNLSYNYLNDIPARTIRRFSNLTELYLSGNELSSLPNDDLEEISSLRVLHINNNKFQVLPAELGKVTKLCVLDVSSNYLKYNVSNWPYDWNWNCNPNLKYLNLSGNKRLEIKPAGNYSRQREVQNLTDFATLGKLRVLGLMDVTLMIPSVPDNTENRRVRTSGSTIGTMPYGLADSLGRNEHLSTLDFTVPRLDGHEDETVFGLFDGVAQTNGGSKIVKFLQEEFEAQFKHDLKQAKQAGESAQEALRRTYLALNKDLSTTALLPIEAKERRTTQRSTGMTQVLSAEDLTCGCVATVIYIRGMEVYVSNVGDAQAVLIGSEGGHRFITEKHDPAGTKERQRIREAGGYVSRQGKLNDALEVSRAFGYTQLMPAVIAAPYVSQIDISESDEAILIASRDMWDYLTPDFAVDLARSERGDMMRAAQKLRDVAIAFGASSKITVMMVGVSDLRKKEKAKFRTHSMSMGPSGLPDEYMNPRRGRRGRDETLDSRLSRLAREVDAPTGEVSLVFTDIKNSTLLWETYPSSMSTAIKMHNEVMRRHLRLVGGYEVKTEGDAFMVAFPTVTSALIWTFTIQNQLLDVQWPQEILNSVNGAEVSDAEGNVLFRGLSVRMGIHWGQPVCETDPVTRRMDYFGPMVNRAARISTVADGGQIAVSSEFIAEIQRLLETHTESDRSGSTGSEDQMNEDAFSASIRKELRSLSSHGFEVKELGERRLKGLENPEYIYLMYPHNLAGRLLIQQQRTEAEKQALENAGRTKRETPLMVELENVWTLWSVGLRLEMLCSMLENPGSSHLKAPETALLERTKEREDEVTDRFLMNFIEHQVSRVETCVNTLALRNMVRPFKDGMINQSGPMQDIFRELSEQLAELKAYKEQNDFEMAPS